MSRPKALDDVGKIISYLHMAGHEERTMNDIVYSCRIPYSSVRKIMRVDFPHCFIEKDYTGWWWTGEPPVRGIPFEPTLPVELVPQVSVPGSVNLSQSPGKWVWNQDALRFLDKLFPGLTFEEVLIKARSEGQLRMFDIVGKTMSRAATQFEKTGKVPYK
jgi:hypothetical protein